MKSTLVTCILVVAQVSTCAAQKADFDYQDGVLVGSITENTGTHCSGTVNGQVDDNGNITGRSESSGNCINTVTHFYTVRVGETIITLRRTVTTSGKTMALATMGNALFINQSVLADEHPGAQFKIRIEDGSAHVKIGGRESIYRIVAESPAPTNDNLEPASPSSLESEEALDPLPSKVALSPETPKAVLDISSAPPGAEIEIDGAFVGNTPSSIDVPPGGHKVSISKKGFVGWERTIKVLPGHASVSPELQPASRQ
jgi:hypothetical protein